MTAKCVAFKFPISIAILLLGLVAREVSVSAPALQELPKLNLDSNRVSVSGVSSGGFMAVQLHVAHSSLFRGVGSVAGGVWECAKGDTGRSQTVCMMNPKNVVVQDHIDLVKKRAAEGEVDATSNLSLARVAIFASPKDLVIKAEGSDKLEEFYAAFVPAPSITRLTNPTAGHGFPTLDYGNICGAFGTPWILDCDDDVAGKILAATEPAARTASGRGSQDLNSILYFDQTKIIGTSARMHPWGAAYIPKVCREPGARCGVHVALHGCQMNPEFIDQKFIEFAGYNEWAESNELVILYPQSAKSTGNPYACWDWFGFTGKNYTTRSAPQIEALRKLVGALGLP